MRHVVGNFIASEDIKSARDVFGYRIEVVQSRTGSSAARQRALAAIKVGTVGTSVVTGPGGHDQGGRCVGRRLKMLADLAIGPNATQRSRTW